MTTTDPQDAAPPDRLLFEYLQQTDTPCPLCGYNLRALTKPRCPECGKELRLTVGTIEPFLRYWLALMVILCAGAGVGLFFVLYAIFAAKFREIYLSGRAVTTAAHFSLWYFLVMIPVAITALACRRTILRWSRARQLTFVALAAIISGAVLAALVIGLR